MTVAVATNVNGCDPSDYQPQKCPVYPGPDPVLQHRIDTTKVRPATYYYHSDHLGSTSWVTDQNGRVHEHVEYFPFGEVWRDRRSESDGAPVKGQQFLFTAKELDEETGLYYFGARYYDPTRGRWLSTDPADRTASPTPIALNPYQYALWSPFKWVDPSGRQERGAGGDEAGVEELMRDRQFQARNTQQGMQEIKPVAEDVAQLNPLIAAHVAATGTQATGGAATGGQRVGAFFNAFGGVVLKGVGWAGRGLKGAWRWAVGAKAAEGAAHNAARFERLKAELAALELGQAARVGKGLKEDAGHRAASWEVEIVGDSGRVFPIRGEDGVQRTLIQVEHEMNGVQGVYEWILTPAGEVSHQRFKAGAVVNGLPN